MLEDSSRHASSVGPWGRRQWRSHQIRHNASGTRWRVWVYGLSSHFAPHIALHFPVQIACEMRSKLTSELVSF